MKDLFGLLGGQQSEVDSLNVLGNQIMQGNDENIRELVRKHLDGLNDNWQRIKEKAISEQPLFVALPDKEENNEAASDGMEILLTRFKTKPDEEYLPDDHLRYQVLFSDVFDWLVRCEESIRIPFPLQFDLEKFQNVSARFMVG